MNGFYLSYLETQSYGLSAGDLLCEMVGGLFREME